MTHCSHCGAELVPARRACERCGSLPSLADPPGTGSSCAACGALLAGSWRHCASCGTAARKAEVSHVRRTSIAAEAGRHLRRDESGDPGTEERLAEAPVDGGWPDELHP